MKNNQTTISNIVNLHQRHNNRVKGKQKKYIKKQPEIIKHVVSINNTQYNMSIEYENTKIVKEFSIGFSMKGTHIKANKVALYKNYKTYFYGNRKTDTTKVSIRVSKVAAIFLLVTNLYAQITENDNMLTTLKNNKKQYKFDKNIDDAIKVCIEKKSELKKTFIEAIKNMLKRYF